MLYVTLENSFSRNIHNLFQTESFVCKSTNAAIINKMLQHKINDLLSHAFRHGIESIKTHQPTKLVSKHNVQISLQQGAASRSYRSVHMNQRTPLHS